MMHIHIFLDSIFLGSYLDFISSKFDSKHHFFFVISKGEQLFSYNKHNNYEVIDRNSRKKLFLSKHLRGKNVKIYIHALYGERVLKTLLSCLVLFKPNVTLIFWGGDLKAAIELKEKKPKSFYEKQLNFMNALIIGKCKAICTLTKEEFKLVNKYFRSKSIYKKAVYINPIQLKKEGYFTHQKKNTDTVNVQVGNSSTKTNNYEEIFNVLKAFKNKDIRIYAMLSYGDESYAKVISQLGTELLGDRFIPVRELMNPQEYEKFLEKKEILVMNNNRQQGLGNIYTYLASGKKVFIRKDSPMWEYLSEECGLKIFDSCGIKDMDYSEFVHMKDEDRVENAKKASYFFYSEEYLYEVWKKIFD